MSNFFGSIYKYEVLHLNIRGARANKENLVKYLNDCNFPEIITINETKLGTKTRFDIPGYNCASRLETTDQGGSHGSMILVRSDIKDILEIEETRELFPRDELIGIQIKGNHECPELKVFTHYLPPKTYPRPQILQYIGKQSGNCILTGDLNCKNIAWGSTKTDIYGEELLEQIQSNRLFFLNDGSKTRCDPVSGNEEVLDVVIANFESLSMFRNFWAADEIGSDHYPLHTMLQFKTKPLEGAPPQEQRFELTNWKMFEKTLLAWPEIESCETTNDIDAAVSVISYQIKDAFDRACPMRDKRKPSKCLFTPEMERQVKEKRRLRRQRNVARAHGDSHQVRFLTTRINSIGNEIKKLQKRERKNTLEKHCENLSKENDPKKFFQTFKKIADPILNTDPLPTSTRQIQDEWGNTAKTAQDKAVLFANRLQKIHQVPEFHGFNDGWKESVERYLSANKNSFVTNPISKYLEPEEGDDSTLLQTVTIKELRENLAKCKNKSAVGLDGISYKLIKRLPDKYLSQIAVILSSCVTFGYFPTALCPGWGSV